MAYLSDLSPEELMMKGYSIDPDAEPSRQAYAKLVEGKSPSKKRWWTKDTVAVVTGSNKGIGFEIVRQIAKEGITTILTARDESRAREAANALKAEGLDNVIFHALDVTDSASAAAFAVWAQKTFGGIDILVCNAGVAPYGGNPYEDAKLAVGTNYWGQKKLVSELLPVIKPSPAGARIVFASSDYGQLECIKSDELRKELNNVDDLTFERLDSIAENFVQAVKEGTDGDLVFTDIRSYTMSKVLLSTYGRLLAKSFSDRPDGKKIYVNLATPGLTQTDMVAGYGFKLARTVQHGADTLVWLALFPSGGPSGQFFRDRAEFAF